MFARGSKIWILPVLFVTVGVVGLVPTSAARADLSWSGLYRVEGVRLDNPELDALKRNKAYVLHHLVLQPKIIASDALTIHGRFDILNNQAFGQNSQLGQFFGSGVRDASGGAAADSTDATNSNVLSQTNASEMIAVTQLYAVWAQQFAQLTVGRMPLQFGLGMTHNAGNGLFDHWYDTRDAIAYKIVMSNFFVMPMIGKMSEGQINGEDDVNDLILQFEFRNPETDLAIGAMAELRSAARTGNDVPVDDGSTGAPGYGGPGARLSGGYKQRLINIFVKRKIGNFNLGMETGLIDGTPGITTAAGQNVEINGYGFASELSYSRPESAWDFALRAGIASGDDPGTQDTFEGFIFDRNYDIGFLLFNHPLGQADFLRTATSRRQPQTASRTVDEEAISNAYYVAPRFNHKIRDQLAWGGNLTWANLLKASAPGASTDLGFEIDLNLTWKPYERFTWVTEAGVLLPGDAWKGGTVSGVPQAFENKMVWGVSTKAAISF